jgi:hypothetical protein
VPGFTINTRTEGTDDNGKPHVELYHSDETVISKIQKIVVESIEAYNTEVYDLSQNSPVLDELELTAIPTTIAMDEGYEIERWEGATHATDILEVLDAW